MQVLTPQPLKEYLAAKAQMHRLQKDLVLFYAQQVPMAAVWLHQGIIQLNFESKTPKDYSRPGLYFLDELSTQLAIKASAKVLAGSHIWLVTRSEIEQFLVTT